MFECVIVINNLASKHIFVGFDRPNHDSCTKNAVRFFVSNPVHVDAIFLYKSWLIVVVLVFCGGGNCQLGVVNMNSELE